jgi:hypothetical protein
MRMRAGLLALVASAGAAAAASLPVVPYPRDYQTSLVRYAVLHLMQKIAPGFGSQNWAFGGFDPLTGVPLKLELPGDCLLCHQAALASDMAARRASGRGGLPGGGGGRSRPRASEVGVEQGAVA